MKAIIFIFVTLFASFLFTLLGWAGVGSYRNWLRESKFYDFIVIVLFAAMVAVIINAAIYNPKALDDMQPVHQPVWIIK